VVEPLGRPVADLTDEPVHRPYTTPWDSTLAGRELRFLATGPTPAPRRRQTIPGAFGHQRVLELGDRPEDLKEHAAHRRRRVDALIEHHEIEPTSLQLMGQFDQVLERPAEPVEFVITSWSPDRATSKARSSSGRRASLPDAVSVNTCSQPAAANASRCASGC